MPELPEVETVRRGLAPVLEGATVARVRANRPDLRFPFPERLRERVEGARVERLERRAKFLILHLSTGERLVSHLGMSGRWTVGGAKTAEFVHAHATDPKHDHLVLETAAGAVLTYNDPRRFGFVELWEPGQATRIDHLGPEPLGNGFNGPTLRQAIRGKKTKIKAALLDQRVVAGLGNIYVCEALFRARISPRRGAHRVLAREAESLAGHIKDVLGEAIEAGGSSLRDFANSDGGLGYFQHTHRVYGREGQPCPSCAAPVRRIVQGGRSSFFCGQCQG